MFIGHNGAPTDDAARGLFGFGTNVPTDVNRATLRLYIVAGDGSIGNYPGNRQLRAYKLTRDWNEQTDWTTSGISNWQTAGGDISGTGSNFVEAGATMNQWIEFDVTDLVKSGVPYGFLVKADDDRAWEFAYVSTREGVNAPELVLEMSAPTPSPAPTSPQPSFLQTFEAESMRVVSGRLVQPSDNVMAFYTNGTIEQTVTISTAGEYTIGLRAYAGLVTGRVANMRLVVDGRIVKNFSVSSANEQLFSAKKTLSAGSHKIRILFTNDFYRAGPPQRDVNLFVNSLHIEKP